jgi:hypothetical protein
VTSFSTGPRAKTPFSAGLPRSNASGSAAVGASRRWASALHDILDGRGDWRGGVVRGSAGRER